MKEGKILVALLDCPDEVPMRQLDGVENWVEEVSSHGSLKVRNRNMDLSARDKYFPVVRVELYWSLEDVSVRDLIVVLDIWFAVVLFITAGNYSIYSIAAFLLH